MSSPACRSLGVGAQPVHSTSSDTPSRHNHHCDTDISPSANKRLCWQGREPRALRRAVDSGRWHHNSANLVFALSGDQISSGDAGGSHT